MAEFVEARLAADGSLRGSEIPVGDIDAFVVFQRLREIDVLFEGELGARYGVTHLTERVSNGWLDCPDFVLTRVGAGGSPGGGRSG